MIINTLVAFTAGFLGAIGVGGGAVLVIYLTLFAGIPQQQAQGMNLLFFLPCCIIGLGFHFKHRFIRFRIALPLIITGIAGVFLGFYLSRQFDDVWLRKGFGIFIIAVALSQFVTLLKNKEQKRRP